MQIRMVEYHNDIYVDEKYIEILRRMIENQSISSLIEKIEFLKFQDNNDDYKNPFENNPNRPVGRVNPIPDFKNNTINFIMELKVPLFDVSFNFSEDFEYKFKHEVYHLIHYTTIFERFNKSEFYDRLNSNISVHIILEAVANYCVFSNYILNSLSKEKIEEVKIRMVYLKDPRYNILENYSIFRPLISTQIDQV